MTATKPRTSLRLLGTFARLAHLLGLINILSCAAEAQTFPPASQYPPLSTLSSRSDVHCVYQDLVGFVWMCTDDGIVRFDGREEVAFGRGVKGLRSILRRRDGQYWVGGASGLYELQSKAVTRRDSDLVHPALEFPFSSVNALTELFDGSLGCATDNGVWVLKDGKLTELDLGLPVERSRRNVRVLFEFQSGSIWAGTSEGLYLRDRSNTMHLTRADGLPDDDIQAIEGVRDQKLLVGTSRGLAMIDVWPLRLHRPGAIRSFESPAALRSADVRAISGFTDVWVGTSTGIILLERTPKGELEYRGEKPTPPVRAFSVAAYSRLLVLTDRDVQFVPSVTPSGGETVLTAVTIDRRQQPIPVDGMRHMRLDVPWGTQLLEIRFVRTAKEISKYVAANRLRPPEESYMLRTGYLSERNGSFSDVPPRWTAGKGVNDGRVRGALFVPWPAGYVPDFYLKPSHVDVAPVVLRPSLQEGPPTSYASPNMWTADDNGWLALPDEGQRRVVIEHPAKMLSAGLHRLVVYGGRRGGPGSSASVDLVIAAAPWVRWWFVSPLAVVVAGAFIGYRAHRRRRTAEITEMRSRIAADLHDSLGASLSRIAILSDVLSQQARERMPDTAPALEAIGDNARSAIDEMNDAVWLIDPEIHTLGQLLVRVRTVAAQLFDPDTSWAVDAPDTILERPLDSDERRHLYLLIKEALTNAHRHARASRVTARFSMCEAGLRVDIEDNGHPTIGSAGASEGNGLGNMRSRAAALGGSISIGIRAPGPGTHIIVQTAIR